MKAGLDKKQIVEAAAGLADEKGMGQVTLKVLADMLGVKPPSLYKHLPGGLEELHRELMLYGWRLLESEITGAAIGKSKDEAITGICHAYRHFVGQHKGVFTAMQWHNMYQSEAHMQASRGTLRVLFQVLDAYGVSEEEKVHIGRMLRGFLQGFSTIESHGGFGDPTAIDDSFDFAIKTILSGIRDWKGGTAQ